MNQERSNKLRKETLRKGAEEFTEKIKQLDNVIEVDIVGSLASDDPYPYDIDLAIFLKNADDITRIAKSARQISSTYHAWEVFVFMEDAGYIGRVCHRKQCPAKSIDCITPKCGDIAHVRVDADFTFDSRMFFSSPHRVLFTRSDEGLFENWRKRLKISCVRCYEKHKELKIQCIDCGRNFIFSVAEQKIYQKREFSPPRRCARCRFKKNF